jgi:hypothetical protein
MIALGVVMGELARRVVYLGLCNAELLVIGLTEGRQHVE